ncbi:MAG: 50S ribosomal protein L10 [Eubacteriales bacterium]|nr:50S ribosomal protein L10 [Eubacteriales bacterium]
MPSKKVLEEKAKIVADLSTDFKTAQAMVFVEYRGLTVAQDTAMRAEMRKAGVTYQVIKNTLSGRALDAIGIAGLEDVLKGPTAIAYSKDEMTAPAKVVKTFADKHDVMKIKGGVIEGKAISADDVKVIASIPSKDVLYGQIVYTLLAPITGLAVALNAIVEKGEAAGITNVAELAVVAE